MLEITTVVLYNRFLNNDDDVSQSRFDPGDEKHRAVGLKRDAARFETLDIRR